MVMEVKTGKIKAIANLGKKVVMMGIKETIKKIYSKSKLPLLCVKRIKKL